MQWDCGRLGCSKGETLFQGIKPTSPLVRVYPLYSLNKEFISLGFFFFLKTPFSLLEKWLILEYYFGLGPQNNSLFFVFAKAKNGGIVQ